MFTKLCILVVVYWSMQVYFKMNANECTGLKVNHTNECKEMFCTGLKDEREQAGKMSNFNFIPLFFNC